MENGKKALLISMAEDSHLATEKLKEYLITGNEKGFSVQILKDVSSSDLEKEIEQFFTNRKHKDKLLFLYISGNISSMALQYSVNNSIAKENIIIIDSPCDFIINRENTALIAGAGITPHLMDFLMEGKTDSIKKGFVDINEIFLYIYKKMVNSEKRDTLCRRINSSGILPLFEKRDKTILPDLKEGWATIKENETYSFFVLYLELDFENDKYNIGDLWTEHIENYLFSNELDTGAKWKKFCGNDVAKKRIYIAPVQKENLSVIKSIFRIFLNKQVDDIRVNQKDIKTRYYFTTLELPYKIVDSSERLIPSCSNIYKLSENLEMDKLYLSRDVIDLLPLNLRKNLDHKNKGSELYTYSFNLLT